MRPCVHRRDPRTMKQGSRDTVKQRLRVRCNRESDARYVSEDDLELDAV
jgi:hypothetical protein